MRAPKPIHFNNGYIEFSIKDNTIYFTVKVWKGNTHGIVEKGEWNESKKDSIINRWKNN